MGWFSHVFCFLPSQVKKAMANWKEPAKDEKSKKRKKAEEAEKKEEIQEAVECMWFCSMFLATCVARK